MHCLYYYHQLESLKIIKMIQKKKKKKNENENQRLKKNNKKVSKINKMLYSDFINNSLI